ncbi:alpha/beta hydrolase [Flammeovirga agarivorans]|uniref:Esterase n=1 Tax=Flammeovirga agarivorans TaxID=2726742 RepID=A0A7X8XVT8_9BACT|nr:alpha/beta hydrolase-fold protein [Flammeovirga agarivorans]NLR91400.1 hypothetical protein [Flammeovirga agarivorans]
MKTFHLILLLIIPFYCFSQNQVTDLTFGKKIVMKSELLSDSVECWVRIPERLNQAKKDSVSLLVLLDGDEYFKIASDVAELYEWSDKMPLTVIVGLPSTVKSRYKYYTPTNIKNLSSEEDSILYSSTGNFGLFEASLSKEIIPQLENYLQVKFTEKTLFGHSNGGLGAMSFYISENQIFDKYIVASPAILWDNYFIQKNISSKLRNEALYLTLSNNGWDYSLESYDTLIGILEKTNKHFKFKLNEEESHSTNGLRTLLDGLIYVNNKNKKIQ